MPQQATTTNQTDDNYTAVDPKKDPIAFVYQNKDALARMDPDKAVKFVDMMFRKFALPKYQQINKQMPLDEDEVERIRLQFAARMFGLQSDQETKLKDPETKYGKGAKVAATVEAAGAGVIGGLRTIEELREKIQKNLGPIGKVLQYDPGNMLFKKASEAGGKAEGKAYEDAKTVTPTGASIGAAIGHQIPSSIAAAGAGGMIPKLAKGAPLALRVGEGAARGGLEASAFEASRPGGDPESGAQWGMMLGGAFPILGKMFGLGRRAATGAATAVEATEAPAAKAATEKSSSLGDVANKAAKDKFGKAFKDLSPSEKSQMPAIMKEHIAKERAQQAATKKAEVAAAKAGREAEAEAKRTEKARAASDKAAQQASKRSATGASTPVQQQAVAAQAATENPAAAKIMQGEDELERARRGGGKEIPLTPEQIKAEEQRKLVKEAEENLKKSGMGSGKVSEVQKIPEGVEGKKVRAKEGKPASPAQQASDRERIAKKRELAKSEEFGSALEKHAQEMAGRHTSGSVGMMHIPELEETMKEMPNGELFLKGFQKLRKAGRLTDEIYVEEMKNWLLEQFEKQ